MIIRLLTFSLPGTTLIAHLCIAFQPASSTPPPVCSPPLHSLRLPLPDACLHPALLPLATYSCCRERAPGARPLSFTVRQAEGLLGSLQQLPKQGLCGCLGAPLPLGLGPNACKAAWGMLLTGLGLRLEHSCSSQGSTPASHFEHFADDTND